MFHPARWHRLVPLALAAAVVVGAGSQVQAVAPPDRKEQAYAKAELIQLLRINTPTAADKQRLTTLDLDLAESAGQDYVDVVAYGNQDRRLLELAGFTWSVLEDDLVGADREREAADAAYAKAVAGQGGRRHPAQRAYGVPAAGRLQQRPGLAGDAVPDEGQADHAQEHFPGRPYGPRDRDQPRRERQATASRSS